MNTCGAKGNQAPDLLDANESTWAFVDGYTIEPILRGGTRQNWARVAAAHGDDHVNRFEHLHAPSLRLFPGDIDALLRHGSDSSRINFGGWFGPAGKDAGVTACEVFEESHRHLGAACVMGAKKQHGGLTVGITPAFRQR